MNRKYFFGGMLFVIITAAFTLWPTDNRAQQNECTVNISDPAKDGVEVGREMTVKGTASIPNGYHLWVLDRRSTYKGVWWPQAEGEIDPQTREWNADVTFGEQQDIGRNFDIGVVIVDEEGHILLQNYRIRNMTSGEWKPIEVPPSKCPPKIRKVIKIK